MNSVLQQKNALAFRTLEIITEIGQPPAVCIAVAPGGCAVGCDDALAALQGLGYHKAEVFGKGWEDKHITPVPDLLFLFSKGITDNPQFYAINAFNRLFKIFQPL